MFAKLRARLTYANVMATGAVFIALGGSSYAAIQVTGKTVKNSSLSGRDIKNNSVTGKDVKGIRSADVTNRSLLAKDFKTGQLPSGPPGPPGVTSPEFVTRSSAADSTSPKEVSINCPAGKTAVSGSYVLGGELPNLVVRQNKNTGGNFSNQWFIQVWEVPDSAATWSVSGWALCAKLG